MFRTQVPVAAAIFIVALSPTLLHAQEKPTGGMLEAFQALKGKIAGRAKDADEGDRQEHPAIDVEIVSTRRMSVVLGQAKPISIDRRIKGVTIDNDVVADFQVNPKNLRQLFVSGLAPGVAQITVTDELDQGHRIIVSVRPDAAPLQLALESMFPDANIEVIPAGAPGEGGVAVVGKVENPQAIQQILDISQQFYPGGVINGLTVVGSQQVQLRVMIAEVSRTKMRSMGFNFLTSHVNSSNDFVHFDSVIGNLASVVPDPGSAGGVGFTFSNSPNLFFGKIGSEKEFRGFLRALKEEGLAKVIAEPTLVAFSGRAADMNMGGEFPIIVPGQNGTFTVEFRQYGNRLDFVPVVLGGGRIRLEVRPELSELDYANGVQMTGFTIPGIKTRRVNTSVELNTGETFVLAGLLSTTVNADQSKVPYIGDIPLIGAAFRTTTYSSEEKELIVMVTPELVEPMKASQKPCSYPGAESKHPSNHDLFFLGNIESPACNPCEITRRSQLGLDLIHTPSGKCHTGCRSCVAATAKPANAPVVTEQRARVPEALPVADQTLRLLGPAGYDAGR
jgi:pilus assembly protein CpaC